MTKQKVQLYPSKVRVVPNCKLAKVTSNIKNASYSRLINGKEAEIVEKTKTKKRGEICSTFTVSNVEGYDNSDPLTFFDYCVLSVCISEFLEGNSCTTAAIILRGLTGKTKSTSGGTHNGALNPDQRNAIMASVTKLMSTIIKIDLSDVNKKLDYNGANSITSTLLPAYFETTTINGQVVEDVIYFDRQSPIFEVADQRNQVIRYDTELLDVPNQNNTPLVITLKNYVMLRVMEIKKHKMTPALTFDDIFKKARIDGKDNKTKLRAREYVEEFFKHLQTKGEIKTFELKKKGNKFYSVEFTL